MSDLSDPSAPPPDGVVSEPLTISTFPETPPEVVAAWDERLRNLWDSSLSTALLFAGELYEQDYVEEPAFKERAGFLTSEFLRLLMGRYPRKPETPAERYAAVVVIAWNLLRMARQTPPEQFEEDYLVVALRPVRKLWAAALTPEVCAALYDYHRGLWTPYLSKPQLWNIQVALAKTIAALPPNGMSAFWENLHSSSPLVRGAMLLGLEFLRSEHAVPHLLRGLEQNRDHATRSAIVTCLEQIADPRAIALLTRLRAETAHDDWTLSRQIARTIGVIEQQNRGRHHRVLLRPSGTPPDDEDSLLRPAADAPDRAEAERDTLLRPIVETPPEENENE